MMPPKTKWLKLEAMGILFSSIFGSLLGSKEAGGGAEVVLGWSLRGNMVEVKRFLGCVRARRLAPG